MSRLQCGEQHLVVCALGCVVCASASIVDCCFAHVHRLIELSDLQRIRDGDLLCALLRTNQCTPGCSIDCTFKIASGCGAGTVTQLARRAAVSGGGRRSAARRRRRLGRDARAVRQRRRRQYGRRARRVAGRVAHAGVWNFSWLPLLLQECI